ncbi:unnamed protein product [Ilex paraguariensis]|uniref:PB1 domain-containing protein n=1 Tax=Ilex paraguariensis TaxID=185542 RepID=A0ABC8S2A6_9AQUA
MEQSPTAPPPLSATAATTVATVPPPPPANLAYPDSVDSSPRSRNTDSWDEPPYPATGALTGGPPSLKLRLMCSYGGHIVPRPHDKSLCYVGGDTRIIVVDRHTSLSDLTHRLSKTLLDGGLFTLKYQLPNEDLDSLISITTDEDLENMIDEYDRLNTTTNTQKSSRLRLFLFPINPESASSIGSLLENSTKSDDWFLNALNGNTRGLSESSSVNCLLGLDEEIGAGNSADLSQKDVEIQAENFVPVKGVNGGSGKNAAQDVQSVTDSPMLETMSSFGSTSSPPALANLPPIRVHVEDRKVGIEEQFSNISVEKKQDDGGFMVLASPPTVFTSAAAAVTALSGVPAGSGAAIGEYPNRVFSDDERSERGMPVGYQKPPQSQSLAEPQPQSQPQTQLQQKPAGSVLDLPSPDSVSSDGSLTNPLSRQKPSLYQDPVVQIPSGNTRISGHSVDPNTQVQYQQAPDSGYVLPVQFDQQHPQLHQQQFIHAGSQYIHHQPAGAVPITYYPVYPSQQQHHPQFSAHDTQYQMFYVPARQAQAYNFPVQQPSYGETVNVAPSGRPQTLPPAAMAPSHIPASFNTASNVPASKSEMEAGMYRTVNAGAPSFIQVSSNQNQPQYVGFSQIHHPSQSVAPTSAATANYTYEYADPTHAQIYYNQPLPHQYQTMTSSPAMVLPEASGQLPTENVNQQIRM